MKLLSIPPSVSYNDFILEKLQSLEHAAGFLTVILEEPNNRLLSSALTKLLKAHQHKLSTDSQEQYSKLVNMLEQTGGEEICTLVNLLNDLGLRLEVKCN